MSVLFVVALWVSGRGVQSLSGDALTSLGRLTGLVSADLLLLQVLLMARIPWAERGYGQDELARRHRLVGFGSVTLMLAHVLLISLGYAATDHSGLIGEVWSLVTTYPGMLLATAGTLALILVAVTSMRAARRKLRYESWHLLHLYAYLGVGLALPHQLWTGADFTSSTPATVFWWTAYAAAAGALLVFRVAVPVVRNLRHRLVVDHVVREGPGVVSVHLRGRDLARLPVRAGQFFVWRFLDGPGWSRGHPFSLSAAPDGTPAADHRQGPRRRQRPPRPASSGHPRVLRRPVRQARHRSFLAEGHHDRGRGGDHAVAGDARSPAVPARRRRAALPRSHRRRICCSARSWTRSPRSRGVRVAYLEGPRQPDRFSWLPARHAQTPGRVVPDIAEHDVYICGPDGWTAAVVAGVQAAGVPPHRIHTESFAW